MLTTFFNQFSIDPIFGNFKPDQLIGLEEGSYVHSIPFSLLTHTGAIGFFLVCLILLIIIFMHSKTENSISKFALKLFIGITALGTIYAFFTWPPFWFFIGFLTVHPNTRLTYNI